MGERRGLGGGGQAGVRLMESRLAIESDTPFRCSKLWFL